MWTATVLVVVSARIPNIAGNTGGCVFTLVCTRHLTLHSGEVSVVQNYLRLSKGVRSM